MTQTTDCMQQALCCECGQTRTFKRARNYTTECDGQRSGWARRVGDLKCANCGKVTRHALLRPATDEHRDYAEEYSRLALGGARRRGDFTDVARIREEYHHGRPENPYLKHLWWTSDARKAREAGESHVLALCGARTPLPSVDSESGGVVNGYLAPEEYRDQEYEDPATGLWWVEIDCVDCLRVSNEVQLQKRRNHLLEKLKEIVLKVDDLDAATVEAIISVVSR